MSWNLCRWTPKWETQRSNAAPARVGPPRGPRGPRQRRSAGHLQSQSLDPRWQIHLRRSGHGQSDPRRKDLKTSCVLNGNLEAGEPENPFRVETSKSFRVETPAKPEKPENLTGRLGTKQGMALPPTSGSHKADPRVCLSRPEPTIFGRPLVCDGYPNMKSLDPHKDLASPTEDID